jgi:hypothetical protein
MKTLPPARAHALLAPVVLALLVASAPAWNGARRGGAFPQARAINVAAHATDQTDFDFEIGTWETQLSRLERPLTGSNTWVKYRGTTVVSKVLQGRANLAELAVSGPSGRIEGVSLRLYQPETRQWTLNFANVRDGNLTVPAVGGFTNGQGAFYNDDVLAGRKIRVRFIISGITANTCHFEQAYSADGGKTWEVNWIADDTRIKTPKPLPSPRK